MPTYGSLEGVEAILGFRVTDSTVPNSTQVASWIDQIEAEVKERALGSYSVSDEYIDVPAISPPGSILALGHTFLSPGCLIFPKHGPIISVTSLYRNRAGLSQAEDWEPLSEGEGPDRHFIVLRAGSRNLGYAIFFHRNAPAPGFRRVKLSYTYGYNFSPDILARYVNLRVAILALEAKRGSSSPEGMAQFAGGGLQAFVPAQYEARIRSLEAELARIEELFPKPMPAGVF